MSTFLLVLVSLFLLSHTIRTRRPIFLLPTLLALVLAALTIPNLLYFQKVLGRLAMPPGLLWTALIALTLFAWHRREKWLTAVSAALFVFVTLAGSPYLGGVMLYSLEKPFRDSDPLKGPDLDAVFVMGGGTGVDPLGRPFLTTSGDRLLLAARVYEEGRTKTLVTSGSTIEGLGTARDLAEEGADILVDMGIEDAHIVRLTEPKNSSQELAAYARLSKERGWQRVGLVTSAWHLRRATRLADREGLAVEPLPADFRGGYEWHGVLSLIPEGYGFLYTSAACWEYLGAAVGR